MRARIASFVKERNEVLFSLDRDRIEAYFGEQGVELPEDDIPGYRLYRGTASNGTVP